MTDGKSLVGETDATVWVKEWMRLIVERPQIALDAGAMLAWFSVAIESGRDAGYEAGYNAGESDNDYYEHDAVM